MTPAVDRDEQIALIESVCARFGEASGWPLRFVSAFLRDEDGKEQADEHPSLETWRRELSLEAQPVGWLTLADDGDDPASRHVEVDRPRAEELAEMTATLVEQTLAARRAAFTNEFGLEALAKVGSELPADGELDPGLDRLATLVRQLTGYRAMAFFLFTGDLGGVLLRDGRYVGIEKVPRPYRPVSDPAPDFAALVNGPIVFRRGGEGDGDQWLPEEMNSAVCMPVPTADGPIGTLWFYDRRIRQPDDRDLHVLSSVATQVGGLLERAVLVRQSEDGKKLDRELAEASENEPPPGARTLGGPDEDYTAAICTTAAGYIGGDLCEVLPLDGRRTLVAIGDACGHGVPAAMVMATARGILHAVVREHRGDIRRTDELVAKINESLCDLTKAHQFMSLLVGVYDGPSRTLTYTNAGHPCPLRVNARGVTNLDSHGLLPGVSPDADYERSSLRLGRDDLLVVFSDGVTEAMSRERRQFRSSGIVEAIEAAASRDPGDLLMAIWRRMESHLEGGRGDDDRTLMVFRPEGG